MASTTSGARGTSRIPASLLGTGISQSSSQSGPLHADDPELDRQENLESLPAVGQNRGPSANQKPDREDERNHTGGRSTEQLRPSAQGLDLAPYEQFQGRTTPVLGASREQLLEGLVAVVASEGPVVGERLHQAYIRASGGQRVGKQLARALNSATVIAIRRGLLVEDNPLNEQGVKPKTYRIPGQPLIKPRQLGPRPLESLPPRELAHAMRLAAQATGWNDEEGLFRGTLERLGLKRLTTSAVTHLRRIHALAQTDFSCEPDADF
jgi:hypothetical protein